MNNNRLTPGSDDSGENSDHAELVRDFFNKVAIAAENQKQFGAAAPAAMRRLAKAVCGSDSSQSITVHAALASIYNGSDAQPVRLDELRWLDWALQVDLMTVLLGTGHAGFEDKAIREIIREVGGDGSVETLHWYTTGGRHRKALHILVTFIKENRHCSSGTALLSCFRSIVHGRKGAALGHLNYESDELTEAFVIVLDGLWGRDKGKLHIEDLSQAFSDAGLTELLAAEPAVPAK
jgi:hypothetical protein